tara:strand:+ start:96 stop:668 length:573 start_codon:yes stop_codon:yes gene_type:complete
MRTIEKVTHNETPKGLPLHVKWTDGRELLRNSAKFEGKEGWEPVSTVGTRVVYDSQWEEYAVYVYINEQRYYPADYFETDKSEALAFASSLRDGSAWGVKAPPLVVPTESTTGFETDKSPKVTDITVFFIPFQRSWAVFGRSKLGNQIGEGTSVASKKEALLIAKELMLKHKGSTITAWTRNGASQQQIS